jgi:hypothetical protein
MRRKAHSQEWLCYWIPDKRRAFSGMTTETDGRGRGYWDEEKSTQPGVAVLLIPEDGRGSQAGT